MIEQMRHGGAFDPAYRPTVQPGMDQVVHLKRIFDVTSEPQVMRLGDVTVQRAQIRGPVILFYSGKVEVHDTKFYGDLTLFAHPYDETSSLLLEGCTFFDGLVSMAGPNIVSKNCRGYFNFKPRPSAGVLWPTRSLANDNIL
jgi:hypothetical protein